MSFGGQLSKSFLERFVGKRKDGVEEREDPRKRAIDSHEEKRGEKSGEQPSVRGREVVGGESDGDNRGTENKPQGAGLEEIPEPGANARFRYVELAVQKEAVEGGWQLGDGAEQPECAPADQELEVEIAGCGLCPSCGTLVDSENHVSEKRETDGDETELCRHAKLLGVGAPGVRRRGRGDRRGAHSQAWTYFGSFETG